MSETNHRPTPDVLDQATGALWAAPVPAGPPADLTAATVAAIDNRLAGAVPGELARRQRRRRIMRYVGFGSATAAAVALATAAGLLWFGGTRAVALDRVVDNVRKAESVTFVERQQLGDRAETEMKYAIRGPVVRIEAAGGTVLVLDTKSKTGLMLNPVLKVYRELDPNQLHGPAGKSPIDDLLALKDLKPESTAEEKLDGKKVQKITIKGGPKVGPTGDWEIWVDPKTELPVKITYRGKTLAGDKEVTVTKTMEDFVWNPKLDDKLFRTEPPEGYKTEQQDRTPPKQESPDR